MTVSWYFRPTHPGDDITDPITGEFFADGSLDNPATALVREALQNALDAGKGIGRGAGGVNVRIGLFRGSHALPAPVAEHWFGTLREHLSAPGNGLRDAPRPSDPCDFIVVEDFGTSGLTGDTESDAADGARNNFVDFMRSDGRTRKAAGDKGSWGVGKNVFPRSSRVNAFIAYTIRQDDERRLVMGKAILKIRRLGVTQYQPACYLGASWKPAEVPRPCEDDQVINRLRRDFNLRRVDQPGLSVVVPWPDSDIRFADVLRAVVGQFYYAILAEGLAVTLADGATEFTLDAASLPDLVGELVPEQTASVALAGWSLTAPERLMLHAPPADRPQKWDAGLLPEEVRTTIADRLTGLERVPVRVPVHVRKAGTAEGVATFFDIFLEHHDDSRTIAPSFFREHLSISGVKRAVGVPRIRALVVIDDEPLATLLRAAEPPNHTDWDIKTANFKNVYLDGNHVVTFVKSAVKQLMGYVRAGEDAPDPNIAIDFFAVAEKDDAPPGGHRRKREPGDEPPEPFPGLPSKPRAFSLDRVHGGFVVRGSNHETPLPAVLYVTVAYDVMIGSAWKLYEPADFDLTRRDRSGLSVEASGGVEFKALEPNRMQLKLDGSDFEFRVTGFDTNRDLIIRAYNPRERTDANTAPELYEAAEADS